MNPDTQTRVADLTRTVVVTVWSVGAALALCALILALAIQPPMLAWIGFAIAATSVLCLAALVPIAFERTRVSAPTPARALDREQRLLVVADSHCSEEAVCDEIVARLAGAVAVHLVVPVRVSHLHFMADDESAEHREAEQSMRITVDLLQQRGIADDGLGRERQATRVDGRRPCILRGHPGAAGDPARGRLLLAGTWAAREGSPAHRRSDNARCRAGQTDRTRTRRRPCLSCLASQESRSRCWPICPR